MLQDRARACTSLCLTKPTPSSPRPSRLPAKPAEQKSIRAELRSEDSPGGQLRGGRQHPGEHPRTLAGRGPGHSAEGGQGLGLEEKPQMGGQVSALAHRGKRQLGAPFIETKRFLNTEAQMTCATRLVSHDDLILEHGAECPRSAVGTGSWLLTGPRHARCCRLFQAAADPMNTQRQRPLPRVPSATTAPRASGLPALRAALDRRWTSRVECHKLSATGSN